MRCRIGPRLLDDAHEFWALRDISFEVNPGEVVGMIGRNGSGKSTLLKILSRITEPTRGRRLLRPRGSIAGSGHRLPPGADRTGKYLPERRDPRYAQSGDRAHASTEIVEFSEIEQFLDTPVKHYSSGMYVRLAFSVAAHLEPEILLLDEVLAVGDIAFQSKCLEKMHTIVKAGRTVLFVSHSMESVRDLCSRVIVLHKGTLVFDGDTETGIERYLALNV